LTSPSTVNDFTLPEDLEDIVRRLWYGIERRRWDLQLRDLYYNGEQAMRQLGIALPPQIRHLRTTVGWPAIAVESLEDRLDIEGFTAGDDDGSAAEDLWSIWLANDMLAEASLAHLDALIFGHSYVTIGASDGDGYGDDPSGPLAPPDGSPIVSIDSPMDMSADWDARTRQVRFALRRYRVDDEDGATLYTPNGNYFLIQQSGIGGWQVVDIDDHNLGVTLVERLSNRERSNDRVGKSEITAEVMSLTDAACRTLVGAEVAREFFGAPQRYILGASEDAFQNADGTKKSAWETYLGRVLALERDEDGNIPQVGQFAAGDPSTYTKVRDMYATEFAARLGLPMSYVGFTTVNPASADAIHAGEGRLIKRAERRQACFAGDWARVGRKVLLVANAGAGAASTPQVRPIWRDASTPTAAAMADATVKLVGAGILPAESDITLRRAGLRADEIAQVKIDRKRSEGAQVLAELTNSLVVKEARAEHALDEATGIQPGGGPGGGGPSGGGGQAPTKP